MMTDFGRLRDQARNATAKRTIAGREDCKVKTEQMARVASAIVDGLQWETLSSERRATWLVAMEAVSPERVAAVEEVEELSASRFNSLVEAHRP